MRSATALAALLLVAACNGGEDSGMPAPTAVQASAQASRAAGVAASAAPSFTSPATATVVENGATAFYQAAAADPDGDPLTYTIAGGADAARFVITAAGALRFAAPPDFELPGDLDGNNVYLVQLAVSDGGTSVTLNLQVTLTNSREGIRVVRVATGFNQPLFVAAIPGETHVYVLEKQGNIYRFDPATGERTLVLTVAGISTISERGLLGMVLLPDLAVSHRAVIFCTTLNGDIELRIYDLNGVSDDYDVAFTVPHSSGGTHNGGWLGFGPDRHLYMSVGDGGGIGDPLHNGQNPNTRLGKILRLAINPDPFASAPPQYFMPAPGNPFLASGGDPYVFAMGLRNPFRASFGPDGRLYIGDVGLTTIEEIDVVRPDQPGLNFGWPYLEGTQPQGSTPPPAGVTLMPPVTEYAHGRGPTEGGTVIGGYVYRGPIAELQGRYVFADYLFRGLWSIPATALVQGSVFPAARYERRTADFAPDAGVLDNMVSFGEDDAGNLFIVCLDGEIYEILPE